MRVLVTGGSGFLGSHVVDLCAAAGHEVVALVRRTSDRRHLEEVPGVRLAYGSVDDRQSVAEAMRDVDAVVHSAGLVKARGPDDFFATNVEGTANLLDAARRRDGRLRRFVFVSSLAAIGPAEDGVPVPPDREPRPLTAYGRSKLAAERKVLALKDELPVVVVRPPTVYGPRDRETFAFFQSVQRGVLPALGGGTETLSMIYATDCAAACVRALDADVPSGRAYFVDDGQVHTLRGILEDIERVLGKRAWLRFTIPRPVVRGVATASELWGKATGKAVMLTRDKCNELFAKHWVCDGTTARAELGWSPAVSWTEGVERTAAWYKGEGWL